MKKRRIIEIGVNLLLLVVPFLFIAFENELIGWLYTTKEGKLTSNYYTLSFFIAICATYYYLGYYRGRHLLRQDQGDAKATENQG